MTPNNMLVGAGFIGGGVLLILFGIGKSKKCSGKAIGKITGIRRYDEREKDGSRRDFYSPEFEYEVDGQIYHGVGSSNYRERNSIQVGGSIEVHYNPKNPKEHFIQGGGKLLPMVGGVAILAGIIMIATAFQG